MKRYIIPVCLTTILLCSCSRAAKTPDQPPTSSPRQSSAATPTVDERSSDSAGGKHGLGDYVSFPACGIRIRQPDGFEKQTSFDGFARPGTQSSVMVMSIPGTYFKAIAGFTQKQMKSRGWTFRSRQDMTVDNLPGILVHFEQPVRGQVFLKWILLFGNEKATSMVMATFPKAKERELSARLKAAVLSTRLDRIALPNPQTDLPFTIAASGKLKLAMSVAKALAYTRDGGVPAKSPKDPLFIAAPALGNVVVGQKRQFAERRLRQTALTKDLAVRSTDAITIDGLDGYESLAEAEDTESRTPLTVYQVILFDEGSYILMQGRVGAGLRDEYLPEFKAMARSLKRKRP